MARSAEPPVMTPLTRSARIAALAVAAIAVACALGPIIAGWFGVDGTSIDTRLGATPPSLAHWFGTDVLGRDELVRVLVGGRIALAVGLGGTLIAVAIGTAYGAIAGYAGGVVDGVMMRAVDAGFALPTTIVVLVAMAITDSRSLALLLPLIGAVSWLALARIVRGQVRALRDREFVVAARALGATPARVVVRHVLPNAAAPVIAYATVALPQVMLLEAFLSFLGVGVQAPLASWGSLVTDGSTQLAVYPWLIAFPALALGATMLALYTLADSLGATGTRGRPRTTSAS
nr:ABC transporter permease [Kofleriaceae bacterium]